MAKSAVQVEKTGLARRGNAPRAAQNAPTDQPVTFVDFKCKESYNGLIDNGICRTLGVGAPDLTDCAEEASRWTESDKVEDLKPWWYWGEYTSPIGKCAVSVYNRTKENIKYSRAALVRWWIAATNECLYPGTAWDSAYCTVLNDKGEPSGVVLVMSRKGHNKDFKGDQASGAPAGG